MDKLKDITQGQRQWLTQFAETIEVLKYNSLVTWALDDDTREILAQLSNRWGDKGVLHVKRKGWTSFFPTEIREDLHDDSIYRVTMNFNPDDYPVLVQNPEYLDYPVNNYSQYTNRLGKQRHYWDAQYERNYIGFIYPWSTLVTTGRVFSAEDTPGTVHSAASEDEKGLRPCVPEFVRFFNTDWDSSLPTTEPKEFKL